MNNSSLLTSVVSTTKQPEAPDLKIDQTMLYKSARLFSEILYALSISTIATTPDPVPAARLVEQVATSRGLEVDPHYPKNRKDSFSSVIASTRSGGGAKTERVVRTLVFSFRGVDERSLSDICTSLDIQEAPPIPSQPLPKHHVPIASATSSSSVSSSFRACPFAAASASATSATAATTAALFSDPIRLDIDFKVIPPPQTLTTASTASIAASTASVAASPKIHLGIKNRALNLLPLVVYSILRNEPDEIYFTGHSLGGGIALCIASAVYRKLQLQKTKIRVYTFGSPRIGNGAFVSSISDLRHYRFVNGNDIVETLPYDVLGFQQHGIRYSVMETDGVSAKDNGEESSSEGEEVSVVLKNTSSIWNIVYHIFKQLRFFAYSWVPWVVSGGIVDPSSYSPIYDHWIVSYKNVLTFLSPPSPRYNHQD